MLRNSFTRNSRQGFNLIELLVVMAVMAILAGLLLPALAKAKGQVRNVRCTNNQRQLLLAWNLYNGDNSEAAAANGHGVPSSPISLSSSASESAFRKFWVPGDDHFYYPAFTNAHLLIDPQYALFGSYLSSAAIYKCPEDKGTVNVPNVGKIPHVRSYAMNEYVGWSLDLEELNPDYRTFTKSSDMKAPTDVFVFQEVHPDNICFPAFVVRMPGEPEQFYHYPSSLHNGRGVVTFADGHAETHRWVDSRTTPPVTGRILAHWNDSPDNADLAWIRQRTSCRIDGQQ
ncbi:MAG: hypothetical protein DME24_22335 [Verrucomicrobia bacterium]|nr:MAG: hypothetical protein DME24_22335 [Verrucomicrobiota bacterium]